MPHTDNLNNRIDDVKFLTKIDLSNLFHHVALDVQSKQFTFLRTSFGQF